MPELSSEQMWNTCWVWKQAVVWITELYGPVSPAIRQHSHSSLQPPCSGYPGKNQHPHSCSKSNKRSQLKDKTGANSIHRLKLYLWGIQFNQFGKQTKWHNLQRLQGGTSKIYKPKNKWKQVPNFCPSLIVHLLTKSPWCWSRSFIYSLVLK